MKNIRRDLAFRIMGKKHQFILLAFEKIIFWHIRHNLKYLALLPCCINWHYLNICSLKKKKKTPFSWKDLDTQWHNICKFQAVRQSHWHCQAKG